MRRKRARRRPGIQDTACGIQTRMTTRSKRRRRRRRRQRRTNVQMMTSNEDVRPTRHSIDASGCALTQTARALHAAARTGAGLPRLHSVGRAVFRASPPRRLRCQRRH